MKTKLDKAWTKYNAAYDRLDSARLLWDITGKALAVTMTAYYKAESKLNKADKALENARSKAKG
jgi:hypothetical protein